MINLLDIDNDIIPNIIKYLKKENFYNFIQINKNYYQQYFVDNNWKNIAINEKGLLFWNIARMRTESKTFPKCDFSLSYKEQLYNIYLYEKMCEFDKNLTDNLNYYELWLIGEWQHNNINNLIKMINYIIINFNLIKIIQLLDINNIFTQINYKSQLELHITRIIKIINEKSII